MPGRDIAAALRLALDNKDWLRAEHRVGDPARYMRHVLYVDPDGAFVMTAQGELTEEQFGADLQPSRTRVYRAGDVAERGEIIHRVSNRSRGTIVSLHLYGVSAGRLTTGINRIYDLSPA